MCDGGSLRVVSRCRLKTLRDPVTYGRGAGNDQHCRVNEGHVALVNSSSYVFDAIAVLSASACRTSPTGKCSTSRLCARSVSFVRSSSSPACPVSEACQSQTVLSFESRLLAIQMVAQYITNIHRKKTILTK